jgi:hypothetical protein
MCKMSGRQPIGYFEYVVPLKQTAQGVRLGLLEFSVTVPLLLLIFRIVHIIDRFVGKNLQNPSPKILIRKVGDESNRGRKEEKLKD